MNINLAPVNRMEQENSAVVEWAGVPAGLKPGSFLASVCGPAEVVPYYMAADRSALAEQR